MIKFIIFSIIYITIFSGYYVTRGFINIVYPEQGFWSFVIFYASYTISNLIAPFITSKFPFRIIFFLSGFTFLIMMGFSSSYISILLFIGSAIGGFGNAFIWLIQGTYLSNEYKNYMGLFYSLFNINMICGNIIALIVLLTGASIQIMFFCMIGLSAIGVVLTLFLNYTFVNSQFSQSNSIEKTENLQKCVPNTTFSLPTETFFFTEIKLLFYSSKKCYLIILSMIYSSIGLNITYQIIPLLLIHNTNGTLQMKGIYTAAIYIVYGISAMIFSVIWGKLFNKNWKFVLYPYTVLEILCLIGILLLAKFNTTLGYWIIFGAIRGCIDYGVNNLINISLSLYPEEDIKYLFALYRFIYSISYLITAICVGYISYEYILLICGIFCILSAISFSFINLPIDVPNSLESQFNNSCIAIV
jgi:MFS family permease